MQTVELLSSCIKLNTIVHARPIIPTNFGTDWWKSRQLQQYRHIISDARNVFHMKVLASVTILLQYKHMV